MFFMYTDGASEAMNPKSEYITEEGMKDIFHESVKSGKDILQSVQSKILEFCGASTPSDDMAMVCIQL